MRKLPVGISSLQKIIDEGYVYIDKTKIALNLIEEGQYYFLSRPRRFGKSLFLDTLKEIFHGNKELFKGLYIYDKYEFEKYPVIKLIMNGEFLMLNELKNDVANQLQNVAREHTIKLEDNEPCYMLSELLRKLHKKYSKRVVLLIDDADKPFREKLFDKDIKKIHDFLLGFYITTKGSDEHIKFSMMTGVHPIKGDMLFGFNNFNNISTHKRYGEICGFTQNELEENFSKHLKLNIHYSKLRQWYNGYKWLGEGVYNPFDILLFIDNNFEYKNYWFSTATPTFLLKVLEQNNYYLPNLENIIADTMLLDSFDVEDIRLETLMWQTGYLTISHTETILDNIEYHLKLPNKEVEQSLLGAIATHMTKNPHKVQQSNMMLKAMLQEDMIEFEKNLKALFASIGYNNFTKNKLYEYEGYFVSVFYAYLKALGIKLTAEDITNKGRIDLTIELPNAVFVIEFKVDSKGALKQIEQNGYHQKYLDKKKPIYLVGIEFDSKERNIAKLEYKTDK